MKDHLSRAEITQHLDALPVLPTVITRLMELDPASANFFEEVLALAQQDPSFATRILSVANSAAYSSPRPLTSLQHAVARIGTQRVVNLVMSMGVMRVFTPSSRAQRNLWIHSVQTAVAASTIADLGSSLKVDRAQAYLGGLMHDLGRFVLLHVAPEEFAEMEEASWNTPEELVGAEKAACGFDHAELGAIACKHWGLPGFVIELVRNHHRYAARNDRTLNPNTRDLIVTVQIADLLSIFTLRNPELSQWEPQHLSARIGEQCTHPSWKTLPVSTGKLADRVNRIQSESERLVSALGLEN